MALTPQTNISLEELAEKLLQLDDFIICGHENPDPDCIGSQLALAHALKQRGKSVRCVLAKSDPLPSRLSFLPEADCMIPACEVEGEYDVFVGVDVPNRQRMGEQASALRNRAAFSFTIDHHACDEPMCDFVYCDSAAAATALIIWRLAGLLGVSREGHLAQACYTGLVGDTGGFRYQNTDVHSFELAAEMVRSGANPADTSLHLFQSRTPQALGLEGLALSRMRTGAGGAYAISWLTWEDFRRLNAAKSDSDGIIDTLRSLDGVRVAALLRESDTALRGSLRSKDAFDVSVLANGWNGGGHAGAAGFTLHGCLADELAVVDAGFAQALSPGAPQLAFAASDYEQVRQLQRIPVEKDGTE